MPTQPNPKVCEHLQPLVDEVIRRGLEVTYVGTPWSRNCRTWVYMNAAVPIDDLRKLFVVPACVKRFSHLGKHEGSETGLVCEEDHDALMGKYVAPPEE